jgi:hypothetical protein
MSSTTIGPQSHAEATKVGTNLANKGEGLPNMAGWDAPAKEAAESAHKHQLELIEKRRTGKA